jgi:hypothetical protein
MGRKKERELLERVSREKQAFEDTLQELRRIQKFVSVKQAQERETRSRPGTPYVETFRLQRQEH